MGVARGSPRPLSAAGGGSQLPSTPLGRWGWLAAPLDASVSLGDRMYLSGALDIRSAFVASLGDRMYLSGALDVRTTFVASLDDCMSSN